MKNFFKSVAIAAALFTVCKVYAQTAPIKETIIIEPFTRTQESYASATEHIRGAVISGFSNMDRFHVIDALSDTRLSALFQNRKYENGVTDKNWIAERSTTYKSLNAKKVLQCQVDTIKEYTKVDKEGDKIYYVEAKISIKVLRATNDWVVVLKSLYYHGFSYTSYSAAFKTILYKAESGVKEFCNRHIFESYVLDLGSTKKEGQPIDLWISGGEDVGIQKGTTFLVKVEKKIGPKMARIDIGNVVAEEVTSNTTRCKIRNKEESVAIATAFKKGITLYIEQKPDLTLYDPIRIQY